MEPQEEDQTYDAILVFGGTHPGHWEKAIEAYHKKLGKQFIVTGGVSSTGVKHPDWKDKNVPEANVILEKLLDTGIPEENIAFENRSRNTLENVLFAKEIFDFSKIKSLLFVCKSHGAGRQYRTVAQHISRDIVCVPFGFDAEYNKVFVTRENWMNSEIGRARVFGEYLRLVYLSRIGHILPIEEIIGGLEDNLN